MLLNPADVTVSIFEHEIIANPHSVKRENNRL